MITASGLSVFFGADNLIVTISGETSGRLYGGAGGAYIYKSASTYKINGNDVDAIYNGYTGGMTNIYSTNVKTVIGIPFYPKQKFFSHTSLNETNSGWTASTALPSGICNVMLSDDGDDLEVVPILTGNYSTIGDRIDQLIALTSFLDSDEGIPQTTVKALITDLQAAI